MNGGDSSSSSSVAREAAPLAPGFRFHPTDEELVSYYLKRKILGKPFKVDAISEIDLYKSEPWDLPRMSLIQSRDMEWYFFSALDKKYANRSRTNRATGEGYWKTTGKDRPVRRHSWTVGMKKTLVFHAGRAPKGERTNWVMHEYRLENEDMVRAGIPQDAYVVCRIFHKSDSGPQNGAQYGAPLLEEEWEDDDNAVVLKEESAENPKLGITGEEFLELIDENQDMDTQNENAVLLGASVDARDGFDEQLDLEELWQDLHAFDSVDANINMPELDDGPNSTCVLENSGLPDQNNSLAILKDDYVELNDFANSLGGLWNDHNSIYEVGDGSNTLQLNDVEEFFDTMEGNTTLAGQSHMYPTSDGNGNDYLELNDFVNPVPGDCPSGEPSDDAMIYFDAPSNQPSEQGYLFEMNDFLNPTMADPSEPDKVDELLAYFDATENNLHYTAMNTAEESDIAEPSILGNPVQQVEGGSIQAYHTSSQASATGGDKGACTSMAVTEMGDRSQVPDVETDNVWSSPLTKRLVSMLGSISSPPAFAAEYPMKGGKSVELLDPETHSSQSIHFTAGMIQINGLPSQKQWPLQKDGDVGFLVSYGMARNDCVGNYSKMHCGTKAVVLQSSCCRFVFSLLFLAVSFKMGVYIYGK